MGVKLRQLQKLRDLAAQPDIAGVVAESRSHELRPALFAHNRQPVHGATDAHVAVFRDGGPLVLRAHGNHFPLGSCVGHGPAKGLGGGFACARLLGLLFPPWLAKTFDHGAQHGHQPWAVYRLADDRLGVAVQRAGKILAHVALVHPALGLKWADFFHVAAFSLRSLLPLPAVYLAQPFLGAVDGVVNASAALARAIVADKWPGDERIEHPVTCAALGVPISHAGGRDVAGLGPRNAKAHIVLHGIAAVHQGLAQLDAVFQPVPAV